MTTIFLSHAGEDHDAANKIRQGLETAGYTVWREPDYPTPRDGSYPYVVENAILGSATVVVLWSRNAAAFAWVKRHILVAQRFFKPLVTVRLDETGLPSMLPTESLSGQQPCSTAIAQILPHLPAPESTDPLLTLGELAAHTYIHMRRAAIDQGAAMLQRGEHREEVLAILEYLARNDLMSGIREKAQSVLATAAKQKNIASPPPPARLQDARHLFDVRCRNGHTTTFDRRQVCAQRNEIMRGLDELILTCPACHLKMAVDVDCEGY
ncbi:MAG TPA: toll/interleukin-1 receptor domain-containing protein [Ktedonobacteraceae bacterium]|jgi:hypothetical protein